MSKRFIDTALFDDDWFMDLSKDAKLLWIYFITKCDHAGILHLNPKLCQLQTGIKDLGTVRQQLGNRIITVREQLFFIPKFVEYQYPGFPDCKFQMAKSAIAILEKYDLIKNSILTVPEQLGDCIGNSNGNGISNGNGKKGESEGKKKFNPPTLDEVKLYFTENGFSSQAAERAFRGYNVANWIDSKGKPVLNWKQKMNNVWFTDENKIKVNPNDPDEFLKQLKEIEARNGN
jgi:hypothetical protein